MSEAKDVAQGQRRFTVEIDQFKRQLLRNTHPQLNSVRTADYVYMPGARLPTSLAGYHLYTIPPYLMSRLHRVVSLIALTLLFSISAMAQTGRLEGVVIDAPTGQPLPGASVRVDGTNIGAASGANGAYDFEIEAGTYEIVATFIGYTDVRREVTITAGQTTRLNIELSPDATSLEDVVVTGLASRRSRELSEVAVSRINVADLIEENTYQDVSQILTGKTAGVNIQPASGNIGGGIRFNIRGASSLTGSGQPIIFVDGVRIDNSSFAGFGAGGQDFGPLSDLNPEDIADMQILKGPAGAAIYGTDGVNGVILITTKRGRLGQDGRFDISYKGTFGQSEQQAEYDDFFLSAGAANDIFVEGDIRQHQLELSGGGRAISYLVSGTYRDEAGILRNTNGTRTNLVGNFEAFPSNDVSLRASASYTLSESQRPDNDNNIFGQLGNVLLAPGGSPFFFTDSLDVFAINDQIESQRFLGSVGGTWRPLEGLALNATAGYDGTSRRQDKTYPQTGSFVGVDNGERNILNRTSDFFNTNVNASYTRDFGKFTSGTTIGSQLVSERIRQFNATAQVFSTNLITEIGAGADNFIVGEFLFDRRKAGVYIQQDLSYDNTYFVTGQLRRDFATVFGTELGSANVTYPAISGAVRLDRFDFVPNAFSILKPRIAYGTSAVPNGFLDGIAFTYTGVASAYGTGAVPGSAGDIGIKPERVKELEFGLDIELLERYGLEFTRFSTTSEDALIRFSPAPSTGSGFLSIPRNVGGTESSGYEFAVNLTPIDTRDFQADLNFTYTITDNEVQDMGGAPPDYSGFDINVIAEGLPRNAFYTRLPTGATFNADGTIIVDGSGRGVPTFEENPASDDFCSDAEQVEAAGQRGALRCDGRSFIGTPYAQNYGGISLGVRLFENLRVSALADFSRDLHVYNNTQQFAVSFGNSAPYEALQEQLGLAADDPETSAVPLAVGSDEYRAAANQYALLNPAYDGNFVQEADFFKLREIAVRYDFSDLIGRTGYDSINRLVLGLSARNVHTWTKYDGPDPEVNFGGSVDDDLGQDFLTLQQPRQLYFTVQVGF